MPNLFSKKSFCFQNGCVSIKIVYFPNIKLRNYMVDIEMQLLAEATKKRTGSSWKMMALHIFNDLSREQTYSPVIVISFLI